MVVSNVEPLASPVPMPVNTFDTAVLEAIISNSSRVNVPRGDINETTRQVDTGQLDRLGITDVIGNMIIFAVGESQLWSEVYLDANVLATSLNEAYRLIFSLAFNSLLIEHDSKSIGCSGVATAEVNAITMVQPLVIILEVVLCLTAILTTLLLILSWNRRSEMVEDPASLSNVLRLTRNDNMIITDLRRLNDDDDGSIAVLRNGKLRVKFSCNANRIPPLDFCRTTSSLNKHAILSATSSTTGIIFISVLFGALITVTVLWIFSSMYNGSVYLREILY